jgi:hypothetical protein
MHYCTVCTGIVSMNSTRTHVRTHAGWCRNSKFLPVCSLEFRSTFFSIRVPPNNDHRLRTFGLRVLPSGFRVLYRVYHPPTHPSLLARQRRREHLFQTSHITFLFFWRAHLTRYVQRSTSLNRPERERIHFYIVLDYVTYSRVSSGLLYTVVTSHDDCVTYRFTFPSTLEVGETFQ